jgi:membrane associated rhomboid family serine protease
MPEVPCAFHPDRLTSVSCSNCGRPICPADMTPAPVGYQCPICTGRAREGSFGAASYRTRQAVGRQVERVPLVRMIQRSGATQILVAANVAVFVVMLFSGSWNDTRVLYRFGAMKSPLPPSEWWRLFTAMFVHIGPLHLFFNMYALLIFGPPIEQRYGKARFLALYLLAGYMGSCASLLFTAGSGPRAGASGGVFGIIGAWIAFFVRHRSARGAREQLRSLFFLVGINLVIGVSVRFIDNFAHLGGLAGGFVVATALEQSARRRGPERSLVELAGYALVIAGGIVALTASGRFTAGTTSGRLAIAFAISSAKPWAIFARWRGDRISRPPNRSGGRIPTWISHPQLENGTTMTSAEPRKRPACHTPR